MIIQILEDVFADGKNDNQLDKLWNYIEGYHSLFLKDDSEIETLMESSWYSGLRGTSKEIIFNLIVNLLQSSSNIEPRIKISNIEAGEFSIDEAIRYLKQPFALILENSYNDSSFFNSLLDNFPKQSKSIKKLKQNGWFQYEMGGGSTIQHFLKTKMDSFSGDIFKKGSNKYLRCFVLIDSDRKYPEDDLKQEIKDLISFLNLFEVPFHVLEKREMENYLPNEAFLEITDNNHFVDAYIRLTPIQKDFFDIENGFHSRRFEQLPNEIQEVYKDIEENEKQIFRSSNLKKINGSLKDNFKSDFPKLFLSSRVNRDNLLARCAHHSNDPNIHPYNPNELTELLTQISSLL